MFQHNLTSGPTFDIDNNILDSIFKITSNTITSIQKGTINIVFLDLDSIQKLNKDYRQQDKATDVLSFHYFEDFSQLTETDIAGEIVLSESHIISQGKEYGLGSEKEFYKLIIHSLLHILGHDHEEDDDYKIMSKFEKEIWEKVFANEDSSLK